MSQPRSTGTATPDCTPGCRSHRSVSGGTPASATNPEYPTAGRKAEESPRNAGGSRPLLDEPPRRRDGSPGSRLLPRQPLQQTRGQPSMPSLTAPFGIRRPKDPRPDRWIDAPRHRSESRRRSDPANARSVASPLETVRSTPATTTDRANRPWNQGWPGGLRSPTARCAQADASVGLLASASRRGSDRRVRALRGCGAPPRRRCSAARAAPAAARRPARGRARTRRVRSRVR